MARDVRADVAARGRGARGARQTSGMAGTANGLVSRNEDVDEMQRRRLTASLVEVVGGHGLHGASVGKICARAAVSRRTFYELFKDRDACLLAAFDGVLARLESEVVPAYRGEGPWHERLRMAIAVLLARFDADQPLARMCVIESLRAGSAVLERRATAVAAVARAVDEGRGHASKPVPPFTAQGVVGGALAVLHAHLLESPDVPLLDLVGSLTAMIVHPYLGSESANEELTKPAAIRMVKAKARSPREPFSGLSIRFTYRTARVLATIAGSPGASNREISNAAGIADDGQTSRLLSRLRDAGLITNHRITGIRGERNAWSLTERGQDIHTTLAG